MVCLGLWFTLWRDSVLQFAAGHDCVVYASLNLFIKSTCKSFIDSRCKKKTWPFTLDFKPFLFDLDQRLLPFQLPLALFLPFYSSIPTITCSNKT